MQKFSKTIFSIKRSKYHNFELLRTFIQPRFVAVVIKTGFPSTRLGHCKYPCYHGNEVAVAFGTYRWFYLSSLGLNASCFRMCHICILSWTFPGSSALRITSVYMDNPWVIFLWFSVRKPLIRVFYVAVVICGGTVYMWQRLSHETVQWLPGTMRHECVIVIRTWSGGINRLCFRMQSNCGRLNL